MSGQSRQVPSFLLLLIGISAGLIATFFPRLLPYLSEADQNVTITLFTFKFILGASAFSLMLGVAMVWLYMGTREHTKNLFMSALALPAVLSGGINMSSFSAVAENRISELNEQTMMLEEELARQHNIEIQPFLPDSPLGMTVPETPPAIPLISSAHASANTLETGMTLADSGSVDIQTGSLEKNYQILLGVDASRSRLEQLQARIPPADVPGLKIIEKQGRFYLIQDVWKTRSRALLDAIRIQEKYQIQPTLMQAR